MAITVVVDQKSIEIGRRARLIRRRRGLSLDVVAGLTGLTKGYLSMLETGKRGFQRLGLIENLATALGCSVTDLTGQPCPAIGSDTADPRAVLPELRVALHDYGPDDVPDVHPRALDELVAWARTADGHRDQARYALAGRDLGTLLTELQVHAGTVGAAERPRTVTALVTAAGVAARVAKAAGNVDVAVAAAQRGYDLACRHDDPGLVGFGCYSWALQLMWLGARNHAAAVLTRGIDQLAPTVRVGEGSTLGAQMLGLMHLMQALTAAQAPPGDHARTHLAEAARLATRLGERNGMGMHFGPTNVAMFRLAVGIELGEGGRAYAELTGAPLDVTALGSRERCCSLHVDAARALAQDSPDRDAEVIRHLDTADRLAPQRTRLDPMVRNLVTDLDHRAHRRVWELDSLCHRFDLGGRSSRT